MRLIRFIAGVLIIAAVLFAFFRPEFVEWIRHHPILDVFVALIAIAFHGVNTYDSSHAMRSWKGSHL